MMTLENSITILTLCLFFLLAVGFTIGIWGRTLPGKGSWFLWAGFLAVLVGVGVDSGFFLQEEFRTKIWTVGWIWPREELSAITVGVLQDPLGLTMIGLITWVAVLFLVAHQRAFLREIRPERVCSGLALSTGGVGLSWNAATPWLAFVGLTLVLLGGFILFGSRWDSNEVSKGATRFLWERASGYLLSFLGASILATARPALLFSNPGVWSLGNDSFNTTWVGSALLVMGLFIQMQAFPFLGGLLADSEIYPPFRTLLTQVFPAWASFALLVRLEPQFLTLGLFPAFGWVALAATFLTVFTGLFQDQWRSALRIWLASGFSLSCALLAFCGPLPGMCLLLGVTLGGLCVSDAASFLEATAISNQSNQKRAIWVKIALVLGTSAASGVIGFVSATGGLRWVLQGFQSSGVIAAVFLFVFYLFVLLGWKLTWKIMKSSAACDTSWLAIAALYLGLLLSLGLGWTGSMTGGALLGAPDRVMPSAFSVLFGPKVEEMTQLQMEDFLSISGLYWSVLIVGFLTAFWTVGRKVDQWPVLSGALPRFIQFIARGYYVDEAALQVVRVLSAVGGKLDYWIDSLTWTRWIPHGLSIMIRSMSDGVSAIDRKISFMIEKTLVKIVEIPAKILQLVQIGDVRWYLLFALGSGFALLSHFLKL